MASNVGNGRQLPSSLRALVSRVLKATLLVTLVVFTAQLLRYSYSERNFQGNMIDVHKTTSSDKQFVLCEFERPVNIAEGHYDKAYFDWQSKVAATNAKYQAQATQQFIQSGDTVFEIGCGGGFSLALIDAEEKFCLEINPIARAKHASSIRSSGSWTDLASIMPPEGVDFIYSWDSLEHHPSPIDTLICASGFLKPGGRILISVPFDHAGMGNPKIDSEVYGRRYFPKDISFHLFTWNPLLLGNLLTAAGFEVENCTDLQQVVEVAIKDGTLFTGQGNGGLFEKASISCLGKKPVANGRDLEIKH
eukprot:TRINITY_DN2220_c0_g2_i1.p1 TRINITY_DN2220_c0_g2~~TRINITY_DN2220_c0_g2_i1.p1  ORF type:complete len:306 (-),score=4.42 TRINITY_DN2220_c0_g2_i1:503-1420(-)